ncbi:cell wall-binding protein [Thelonectria olida]|uniref:Cell wall-binding protein n=1 Tax=Thelonectria olida TaxID=1576542 RepID=A0A9P8VTJ6_9HYPO|nr:cell wall-binding protein [Thelonectria olida]
MKAFAVLFVAAVARMADGLASTDTITWGGDNSRAGYQTNHNMDPAVVGSSAFDQLFKTLLPGRYLNTPEQVFSQPLVYTPSGGTDQYVYWATTQNNIYKMDAKTGKILKSRNLHIPFLTADLDGCVDINPTVGITATGVIDPATNTIYYVAKTYLDQDAGPVAQGRPAGRYYIHAVDADDLSERPNFPINLEGLIANNNPERMFTGGIHHCRPGLLLTGQYVYTGYASHCVQYNFTGWIIGFDKTSGNIVEKWATEGEGVSNDIRGGGIWMSGGGIASDDAGSIFFGTGNGYASQLATIPVNGFQPPTSMEQAAVHMTIQSDGSLKIVDFFIPYEKQALDGGDKDLGTSPLEILPSQFSCGDIRRIGVITGKSGKTYWLNLDNLGGYRNGPNQKDKVIQTFQNENSVYAGAGVYPLEGGYIYINVIQYPTHVFKFSCTNGVPSFTKVADSPTSNAYILGVSHGTTTSLSGQEGTGLLWVTDVQGTNFKIYKAVPQGGALSVLRSFTIPGITKFTRPVFGDGIAYIGTTQGYVYGYGSITKVPLNCTAGLDFGTVDVGSNSSSHTINCTAVADISVTKISLENSTNYAISGLPSVPFSLKSGKSFTMDASFAPTGVGRLAGNIIVNATVATGGSYNDATNVRLTGIGKSSSALLTLVPKSINFTGVVVNQDPDGQTVLLNNDGGAALNITSVSYSDSSATGPWQTYSGTGDIKIGQFTLKNIPKSVDGGSATAVTVLFDSSSIGTFSAWVQFKTMAGDGIVSISGTVGSAPVALIEFQKPDGSGWVEYQEGQNFTFGNVTENTTKSLKLRVTNNAPTKGVSLSLTVSKPPFGVSGIVRAVNQVDLAEGTSLAPGQSATAVLTCTAAKSQWNVDPYNGTAQWTMNTNDPNMDKQFIQFFCNAVAEQAPPLLPNGQGKYRYLGCFRDNNPGRQLTYQLLATDTMTTPMCIAACAAKGYVFCGTQYHRECWGGNTIPNLQVVEGNCNFDCAADLNQICGGNGIGAGAGGAYLSTFVDSTQFNKTASSSTTTTMSSTTAQSDGTGTTSSAVSSTSVPTGPFTNPGVNGYTHIGCYTEGKSGRALPNGKDNNPPTVANCVTACSASSFTYAGVEYGGECWCGNSFSDGSVLTTLSDCNMVCNGNSTEYCGAGNRLNVYQKNAAISPTSTASTSSTSSSASISSTGSTSSVSGLSTTGSSRTSSTTGSSGTSSSSGSSTITSSTATTATSSTSTTTSAKPTGPQISPTIGAWTFQGCWTEATGMRALNSKAYSKDDMTLENCAAFCDGYTYFGAEYGRECFCGNQLNTGSAKADNQKDCSFTCPGDSSQYCGAGNRLQLYMKGAVVTTSSTTTTSSSTSSSPTLTTSSKSSTTASTTQSGTSSNSQSTPAGSIDLQGGTVSGSTTSSGTSSGSSTPRSSTSTRASSTSATPLNTSPSTSSITTPKSTGTGSTSSTSGTTRSGTSTATTKSSTSSSATSSSSTTKATTKTTSTTTSATKSTTPSIWPGNENFTIYSCVSEPSSGRVLKSQPLNLNNMTVEMCLEKCWAYKYVGVEYGVECWCGNALDLDGNNAATPGKNVSDSDCNFLCPGDKLAYCGAGNRLNMYINNVTSTSTTMSSTTTSTTTKLTSLTTTTGSTVDSNDELDTISHADQLDSGTQDDEHTPDDEHTQDDGCTQVKYFKCSIEGIRCTYTEY